MNICLSKEACSINNITLGEALLLLAIANKANLEEAEQALIKKGYITADRNDLFQQIGWRITSKGTLVIDSVIVDSDKNQKSEDNLINLATKLKEIFPKGKKSGTNYYWADGVALIVRRLKLFFKKYGNIYTNEQIVQAAEKYVQGFNGDYQYMKLLKYFILKEKVGADGEVEGESDLISYIENAGQEDELSNDWTTTLR